MMSSLSTLKDHFPVRPGLALSNGRYTIKRKLGSGVFSSTYLVQDSLPTSGKYLSAKILTLEGTQRHHSGEMHELEFLEAIRACEDINSLPVLRDHLELEGPYGSHLCFIMDLLSTDVSSFRRSFPTKALPPFFVKNIIALTLEGLEQLHDLNIVHTDIKPDNILFGGISDGRVDDILSTEAVVTDGSFELNGEHWPILKSQPIPHSFSPNTTAHDAELIIIVLTDLGQAQWAGKQPTVDDFSARSLRAPEVILRSEFGPKLDIWSIGCITFELLVGRWLFNPEDGGDDWRLEDDHLAKMIEITGETFSASTLERSPLRDKYFDKTGKLLRIDDLAPVSLETALSNYNLLPLEEIGPAADFIRTCIRLDPHARPSAKELQLHPWLEGAFKC